MAFVVHVRAVSITDLRKSDIVIHDSGLTVSFSSKELLYLAKAYCTVTSCCPVVVLRIRLNFWSCGYLWLVTVLRSSKLSLLPLLPLLQGRIFD